MAGKWKIRRPQDLAAIAHLIASIVFLAIAVLTLWQAWSFQYLTPIGPGPGFFPLWVGGLLAALSVVLFLQACFATVELPDCQSALEPQAVGRILAVLAALILFAWALEPIGFSPSAFIFCFSLFLVFGGVRLIVSLPIAIASSIGVYYVFRHLLGVHLPESPVGLLPLLGL